MLRELVERADRVCAIAAANTTVGATDHHPRGPRVFARLSRKGFAEDR